MTAADRRWNARWGAMAGASIALACLGPSVHAQTDPAFGQRAASAPSRVWRTEPSTPVIVPPPGTTLAVPGYVAPYGTQPGVAHGQGTGPWTRYVLPDGQQVFVGPGGQQVLVGHDGQQRLLAPGSVPIPGGPPQGGVHPGGMQQGGMQPGVNGPRPPALPGPDVVLGWGGLPPVSSQPAPVYAPAPGRGGNARR